MKSKSGRKRDSRNKRNEATQTRAQLAQPLPLNEILRQSRSFIETNPPVFNITHSDPSEPSSTSGKASNTGPFPFSYCQSHSSRNFDIFGNNLAPSYFYPIHPSQSPHYGLQPPPSFTCSPLCGNLCPSHRFDEISTLESVNRKLDRLLLDSTATNSSSESPQPYECTQSPTPYPDSSPQPKNFDEMNLPEKQTAQKHSPSVPLGVFWDIENCSVPKGKSALDTVQRIRHRFLSDYIEAEFLCVCDVGKESPQIIQELNDAQVTVVHVSGNSKNAADDKLRQAMGRYADVYTPVGTGGTAPAFDPDRPPSILLISGDVNFSPTVNDLRYRKRLHVILLHNAHAPEALLFCAHEHYNFHTILEDLPQRTGGNLRKTFVDNDKKDIPLKGGHCPMDLVVTDLPNIKNLGKLKSRLRKLSDNCGGKVVSIQGTFAVIRFPNKEAALRASKRMNGEDVFGSKIKVIYSSQMEFRIQSTSRIQSSVGEVKTSAKNQFPVAVDLEKPSGFEGLSSLLGNCSMGSTAIPIPTRSNIGTGTPNWNKPSFPRRELVSGQNISAEAGQSQTANPSTSSSHSASSSYNSSSNSSQFSAHPDASAPGSPVLMAGNTGDNFMLKKEIASLLHGVPNFSLPLFKFREMFEKRYRRSIASSDLYKLTDVVAITGGYLKNTSSPLSSNGRTITLRPEWQNDPTIEDEIIDIYCPAHPPQACGISSSHLGWAEKEIGSLLPNVIVELKDFAENLFTLIESHGGGFPLLSFLDCYESAFPPLRKVLDPEGVPLEHIIGCVAGVEICTGENGMKRAQLVKEHVVIQPMGPQLVQLSRELVDLLKTSSRCSIPFSKLIPAYHHHFGKQCKVSDYGHSSLFSLLQTMPSTIQILGDTNNRIITLCHRAQMKRFATDVLRVLKAVNGTKKQVELDKFPSAFEQLFSKPFAAEDYGLCFLSDLIQELVENSSLVTLSKNESGKLCLSIPRRGQTSAEVQKMRVFALEVVEMLRHSVRCEIPFSRFIPSYHHHFGTQCRVSSFGFSKLIDLLEAIPDTVEIVEPEKETTGCLERTVRLTAKEQLKVIGEQIWTMIHKRDEAGFSTYVYELEEVFANEYGYSLRPELCGASDIRDVCAKLHQFLHLENDAVKLVGRNQLANDSISPFPENTSVSTGVRNPHPSKSYGVKNKNRSPLKISTSVPNCPSPFSPFGQWENQHDFHRMGHMQPLTVFSPSVLSPTFSAAHDDANVFSFDGPFQPSLSPPFYDTLVRDTNSPCLSPQFVWTYPVPYYPPPTPPGASPGVMVPTFSFNAPWTSSSAPTMLSGPCFEQFPPQN